MAPEQDTRTLVCRAVGGDGQAWEELLTRHRGRLRRMIAVRLDSRLAARVDPSDVIQEVLAEAAEKLPMYAGDPPLPFYPWLRQMAWERLLKLHDRHLRAKKRSATREQPPESGLSDATALSLAELILAGGTSPSGRAVRKELRDRVQRALRRLDAGDREILVMRHLEQLQVSEIAALLKIGEGAVKMRRLRAAERLRELLESEGAGESLS